MSSSDERLNILFILTDQHRYDTLGCYGAPICRTPNIDSIAERGVRFERAYTPASPCSPARAALFTGLYPHKNHVDVNDRVLNPDAPTLASELGEAGYNLGYAGKWHVDRNTVPTEHGFVGKDFPGYGYPAGGGIIDGLRFGGGRRRQFSHYQEYLDSQGLCGAQ